MAQTTALILGFIVIFMLVSGLIVLWRRGRDDLDAWGLVISRVLRGDPQSTRNPRDTNKGLALVTRSFSDRCAARTIPRGAPPTQPVMGAMRGAIIGQHWAAESVHKDSNPSYYQE